MSDSDLKLYAYVSAFVTTSPSEQLWYSQGTNLSSFQERIVAMPDGKKIRIAAPSEQARLWATLCSYWVQAKQRLEASMNAVLTIRPMVGEGADPIQHTYSLDRSFRGLKRPMAHTYDLTEGVYEVSDPVEGKDWIEVHSWGTLTMTDAEALKRFASPPPRLIHDLWDYVV
jgi:hypothetical protein